MVIGRTIGPGDAKGMSGYAPRLQDPYTEPVTGKKFPKGRLEPLDPQTTIEQLKIRRQRPLPKLLRDLPDSTTVGDLRKVTGEVGLQRITKILKNDNDLAAKIKNRVNVIA